MTALATDHGYVRVVDFYEEAIKHDLKPIIGCESTWPRSRFQKEPGKTITSIT